ncbi:hypothetical protein VVD49_01550 [Uliginosibacterium sp. H3]|uniref:DUF6817 domain-containing protein n=1 Tax=Uliginosibacterium silvisoli TaxID=3114758 RepID=A0ABU6JYH2_9RHOO|nr:hypothetical protein [Uliginosibacterium sp. H3]
MRHPGMLPGQQLPRDARSLAAINLLLARGADKTAHANERSLLEHLIGTARLLLLWNAPIDTVRAGLCHSIYGTNAFRTATMRRNERALLQQTIGRRAEALVWSFSRLRRPATLQRALRHGSNLVRERSGRTRHIDSSSLQQLFILECANLLDQGVSMTHARRLLREATRLQNPSPVMLEDFRRQQRYAKRIRCTESAARSSH